MFLRRVWQRTIEMSIILGLLCQPGMAQEQAAEVSARLLKASLSKTQNEVLSLRDVLEIARDDNPTVKASQDAVNEARARYWTRLSELLPDLNLTYDQRRYDGTIQGFGGDTFQVERKTYNPQILFRFPIFQGGRQVFQTRAAKKSVEAEAFTSDATMQQTLRQAGRAYYELKLRLDQIAIAQKQLEETQAALELNKARMEAGAGTRLDVSQSEAQLARAQRTLLDTVRASEVAAVRLNEILDLPAMVSVVPAQMNQDMVTLVPLTQEFDSLLAVARTNRPELKTLAKQTQSLTELRRVAWSAVFPEVAVQYRVGGVGSSMDEIGGYEEPGLALDFNFKNLTAPAWTRYRENTFQIERLKHQLQAQENAIQRELSEAFLQALSKQSEVGIARTEVRAAEDALRDAVVRLKVGVGRNIDVLNAETEVTLARNNLSRTIMEYNQAQVDLVYALGLASVETLTQGVALP